MGAKRKGGGRGGTLGAVVGGIRCSTIARVLNCACIWLTSLTLFGNTDFDIFLSTTAKLEESYGNERQRAGWAGCE